jgi:hypothetical protein
MELSVMGDNNNYDELTSIQSSGPTPSTVTLVELLSNTNFSATGFLLVAMVTGTRQRLDSKPASEEEKFTKTANFDPERQS